MRPRLTFAVSVLLPTLLLLQSCGWQLRGYEQFKAGTVNSIEQIHLRTTSGNRLFQASLKRQLEDLSIALVADAKVTLILYKESTERRPLSYGSTGIPVQYQLVMTISYAYSTEPNTVPTQRKLIARRQYDFDTSLVVAKKQEERNLLQEMRDELAARIIASVNE